jgi:Flp pilus assembly protein TadG
MTPRLRSQSGAVLIFVAVSMIGLLAFASIAVDYGVMWTGRSEAQNAADAGAIAGAHSLVLSEGDARAREAALKTTMAHRVFGQMVPAARVTVTVPFFCPTPYNVPPVQACIKVVVTRPDTPTFFAKVVGVNSQTVNAMAVAMAGAGNASSCLRPWFIPDGWEEHSSPANTTFNPGVDIYRLPNPGPGTGYTTAMIGTVITLTEGDPHDTIAPGNYYEADITGGGGGTSEYSAAITGCVGVTKHINPGTTCPLGSTDPGCMNILPGRRPNANINGAEALINADPYAYVDVSLHTVVSGCAPNCTGYQGLTISPRLVPVAMFNPQAYVDGKVSGNMTLPIVNIMGIFIQSVVSSGPNKGNIIGVIVNDPAIFEGTGGSAGPASFLMTTILVR